MNWDYCIFRRHCCKTFPVPESAEGEREVHAVHRAQGIIVFPTLPNESG